MSETRALEELFSCGDVLVDVGFDTHSNLVARTEDSVMGYADLGGEISVTDSTGERVEYTEDGRLYAKPEAWAELLREMRDMLARCMILGRMEVTSGDFLAVDELDFESIQEAKKLLGEQFFDITLDTAITVIKERRERQERAMQELLRIRMHIAEVEFRRDLNKEVRAKTILREALGPEEENEGED